MDAKPSVASCAFTPYAPEDPEDVDLVVEAEGVHFQASSLMLRRCKAKVFDVLLEARASQGQVGCTILPLPLPPGVSLDVFNTAMRLVDTSRMHTDGEVATAQEGVPLQHAVGLRVLAGYLQCDKLVRVAEAAFERLLLSCEDALEALPGALACDATLQPENRILTRLLSSVLAFAVAAPPAECAAVSEALMQAVEGLDHSSAPPCLDDGAGAGAPCLDVGAGAGAPCGSPARGKSTGPGSVGCTPCPSPSQPALTMVVTTLLDALCTQRRATVELEGRLAAAQAPIKVSRLLGVRGIPVGRVTGTSRSGFTEYLVWGKVEALDPVAHTVKFQCDGGGPAEWLDMRHSSFVREVREEDKVLERRA